MPRAATVAKPLSDAESRRVIREELAANLLVEAGAGSGKTQMLAERMAAGIASGAYKIEHLAAVTFTRKAASELRGRFHLALERVIETLDAEIRDSRTADRGPRTAACERVNSALANLERFFAGTIHSFCARLLRERPVESGVSPGFTELDEVQDEELRSRSWSDFIASTRSAGDKDMLALLETGVRPPDLESAFAIICGNEDVEFPPGDGACPDPKPAWKVLEKFWKALERELPDSIDPGTKCKIQLAALEHRRLLRVAKKRIDRPSVIATFLDEWDCESSITLYRWATHRAEQHRIRDVVTKLHADFHAATVAPYLTAWRQYVYRLSVTLLSRARDYAAAERRRRNSLNYGDLLNLTAKVLRENAHVRHALQQKYRHLFVDEFQDTDPVQAEIVFLLAAQEVPSKSVASAEHLVASAFRRKEAADWRTVPLRPAALFVVGDPKQSIYRFRRADIEIYNTVRDRFSDPSIGRVVSLTTNFRSVPELCEWANGVFDGLFPPEPTQQSPRFARLDPHDEIETTKKSKGSTGLFTLKHACDEAKEVAEVDAAAIARYIRSEVDAGRRKYSDFLILTRKKKDRIAPYATALEALNVPIEVSGAGAFGDSPEVAALTVLLRALADHQDQLTLVNVLRGPLFGISDPELFEYKQSGGWFSIFAPENVGSPTPPLHSGSAHSPDRTAEPGQRTAVPAALAALNQYYRWTRMLPAGAALDKILEHTGYLALAATTPGGVEAGDLLHAVDRVRQVLEDGGNLADAADALAADGEAPNEVESLPLESGRSDVVRLMNLHKAKGLEADVVFLADPCGGMKRRVDVHIKREGTQAFGWFNVEKKSEGSFAVKLLGQHADWDQHKAAEEPYLAAEENRLLYVAATRAKEMLVVSCWNAQKGNPAWGALNGGLATAQDLPVPAKVKVASPKPAPCAAKIQAEAADARAAAEGRVNQASWSITSATAEARHVTTMTRASAPAAVDDATRVVAQDTPSHRADAGMAWGTLIHALLEHAMRFPDFTSDDLRRLAMWLTVEEPQLRAVIDVAIDTVKGVASAEFWHEAKASEHSEESPFVCAEASRLTIGVIDLMHRCPRGWRITDYKTDTDDGAAKAAVYETQQAAYRRALEACGVKVDGVKLQTVRMRGP